MTGKILRIFEEGNSRLFLVADQGPVGARQFSWENSALVVRTDTGVTLCLLPLPDLERALILEGRAHWLECQGDRLTLDQVIVLAP